LAFKRKKGVRVGVNNKKRVQAILALITDIYKKR
jgi:hypothetical protein